MINHRSANTIREDNAHLNREAQNTANATINNQQPRSDLNLARSLDALIHLATHITPESKKNPLLALPPFTLPSLLLSQHGAHKDNHEARFSFFLANPNQTKRFYDEHDLHEWQKNIAPHKGVTDKNNHHIPLHSGWVGYYSYPTALHRTDTTNTQQRLIAEFYYYPWTICLNHQDGQFYLLGNPDANAQNAFNQLTSTTRTRGSTPLPFACRAFKPSWQKHDYTFAFQKIQEYLLAGDCYQVNLTQPHKTQYTGNALATLLPLYQSLNPSFGCYFQGQDCELISLSPERFIKIDNDGKLEAKPIKGTIKRSTTREDDADLISRLKSSTKDKAENLMIVDLLRNDLSLSAKPGSVNVDKLFAIESQPNVHHLVSTISAEIKTNTPHSEAIYKAFPGGSITGAPKKRAMEIIAELEHEPRSLYCGSFGYYSDSGHTDFNILIRSLEFRDNHITCWGGGGITVDSTLEGEYEESLTKIRRIMDVVEGVGE